MQRTIQITSRDFELSDAVKEEIRAKAQALDTYYERITGCEVVVSAPAITHHRKGGPFVVRIRLTLPGGELMVDRQPEEELSQAIREAFDAARRRLEDHVREMRGSVKAHEPLALGRITELFPEMDYGRLQAPDGRDIYFHRNSVLGNKFDRLSVGNTVRFVEEQGEKGPQASSVTLID